VICDPQLIGFELLMQVYFKGQTPEVSCKAKAFIVRVLQLPTASAEIANLLQEYCLMFIMANVQEANHALQGGNESEGQSEGVGGVRRQYI